MSEHLKMAREAMENNYLYPAMWNLIRHLESQEQRATTETCESSSSSDTEMQAEIPPTWSTSSTWSSPVNLHGELMLSVAADILDWLSSRKIPGSVQEVEIGVTLHSKVPTLPDGSLSPSTGAPTLVGSGAAGEPKPARYRVERVREGLWWVIDHRISLRSICTTHFKDDANRIAAALNAQEASDG